MLKKFIILISLFLPLLIGVDNAKEGNAPSSYVQTQIVSYLDDLDRETERRFTLAKEVSSQYNENFPDSALYTIVNLSFAYDNLSVEFICATITHESAKTWDPKSRSPVGAKGLMQIMPATGKFLAKAMGIPWSRNILYDPVINIRLGCDYLSYLVDLYGVRGGLAAYNSGPERGRLYVASNYNPNKLLPETRKYVPAIIELIKEYEERDI